MDGIFSDKRRYVATDSASSEDISKNLYMLPNMAEHTCFQSTADVWVELGSFWGEPDELEIMLDLGAFVGALQEKRSTDALGRVAADSAALPGTVAPRC